MREMSDRQGKNAVGLHGPTEGQVRSRTILSTRLRLKLPRTRGRVPARATTAGQRSAASVVLVYARAASGPKRSRREGRLRVNGIDSACINARTSLAHHRSLRSLSFSRRPGGACQLKDHHEGKLSNQVARRTCVVSKNTNDHTPHTTTCGDGARGTAALVNKQLRFSIMY